MGKRNLYISLGLNVFNAASVIVCSIFSFLGGISSIKMFTVQSNILTGIVAIVFVVFEVLVLLKKKEKLPPWLLTLKMVTTTGVALTFFVVAFFLSFIAVAQGYSYFILFRNINQTKKPQLRG